MCPTRFPTPNRMVQYSAVDPMGTKAVTRTLFPPSFTIASSSGTCRQAAQLRRRMTRLLLFHQTLEPTKVPSILAEVPGQDLDPRSGRPGGE
jgi:hypothetical protein